jgi:hypothetical protein
MGSHVLSYEFLIHDLRNLRHDFMRTHFEFWHILHLVLMAALNFTELRTKLTLVLVDILWKA